MCQAGTEDLVRDPPNTAVWRVRLRISLNISGGWDLRIPNSFPSGERLGWKVARHTHKHNLTFFDVIFTSAVQRSTV